MQVSRGVHGALLLATGLSWFAAPWLYGWALLYVVNVVRGEPDAVPKAVALFVVALGVPVVLPVMLALTRPRTETTTISGRLALLAKGSVGITIEPTAPAEAVWAVGPLAAMGPASWSTIASTSRSEPRGHIGALRGRRGWIAAEGDVDLPVGTIGGQFAEDLVTLVGPEVDPSAWQLGGELIDLRPYGVIAPWRAVAKDAKTVAGALTARAIRTLNGSRVEGALVHRRGDRLVVWQDASVADDFSGISILLDGLAHAWRADLAKPDDEGAGAKELAGVGRVRGHSRVDMILLLGSLVFGETFVVSVLMIFGVLGQADPVVAREETLLVYGLMAAVGGALAWPMWRKSEATTRRKGAFALDVRRFASARGWTYESVSKDMAAGWVTEPLRSVSRLSIGPIARGGGRWGRAGVAFAIGDLRVGGVPLRPFLSRMVWTHLADESPPVSFMREGFSDRLAGLVGGTDVDVESAAFNRLWRVKSPDQRVAHAMLTPTLISFLTEISDEGLAFQVDGDRVLLWDDGRDTDVDLDRRMELVERFVGALPSYLRERYMPR